MSNWIAFLGVILLVVVLGLWNPLFILAVFALALGAALLAAAIMKRRPVKPAELNSIYLFPGEFESRVAEAIWPGFGNWYLRFVCFWCALMFFAGSVYLFGLVFGAW